MQLFTRVRALHTATLLATFVLGFLGYAAAATAAATGKPVAYAITPNNTITVIDTGNHTVLNTITLAAAATYIVGTPDGKQLYVTSSVPSGWVVWVIDTQTNTVKATIPLDLPGAGMAVSADGSRVYVLTALGPDYQGAVTSIDTVGNTVVASTNTSAPDSQDMALAPNGARVYVPNLGGKDEHGSLDVFDTASHALIKTIRDGDSSAQYFWSAVSPDSSKVYADASWIESDVQKGGVAVYSPITFERINVLQVAGRLTLPLPGSSTLYGSNGGGVTVFNTQTDTTVATVPVAGSINNLALTPDAKELYVSNSNAQSIAILATATNAVTGSVSVAGATGLAIVAAPPPPVLIPPQISVQVAPASVPPRSQSQLAWTVTGATSCVKSGAWSGAADQQGSILVSQTTPGSYTYTLSCTGPGGSAAASAKLTVVPGSTISFSATDVPQGSTLVVSWKAFAGATSCQGNGDWAGALPVSGSKVAGPYAFLGIHKFPLTCFGPDVGDGVEGSINVYAPGALGYTNVTPANNNVNALGTPGKAAAGGGLDGHGYTLNGQDYSPKPLTVLGQTFTLVDASKPSGLSNQTVALGSAQLAEITLLATAVNGNQPNQAFVVTYSDGTTKSFTQSVSDWHTPQGYPGEVNGVNFSRLGPTGALQPGRWWVYAYRLPLDATRKAVSLKLPPNRNVVLVAINETRAPTASPESLAAAYNVNGLATLGHAAANGGLDGHGYALDASMLPTGFSSAGQTFAIGPAGQPDGVSNKVIPLTAKTRLGLTVLATAVNGSQPGQTFLVTYQDGTTTAFTQSVSDWHQPQHYAGEIVARATGARLTPAGVRQAGVWDVYAYTFQTDPGKQVVSVTLPKNRNVVVFALNSLTQ